MKGCQNTFSPLSVIYPVFEHVLAKFHRWYKKVHIKLCYASEISSIIWTLESTVDFLIIVFLVVDNCTVTSTAIKYLREIYFTKRVATNDCLFPEECPMILKIDKILYTWRTGSLLLSNKQMFDHNLISTLWSRCQNMQFKVMGMSSVQRYTPLHMIVKIR